jgi:hypothetical protein
MFSKSRSSVGYSTIAKAYTIGHVYIQPTFEEPLSEEPEIMLDFLAFPDTQCGGTRTYLLESCVSESELTCIQHHLLGQIS